MIVLFNVFLVYSESSKNVLPIVIKNTRTAFEAIDSLKRVNVYVQILPPIDTSIMSEDELKNVHSVVEKMIRDTYSALPEPYAHR